MELNTIHFSGRLETDGYSAFLADLEDLLKYYSIAILADRPTYHLKAFELRKMYELTYFDSLHAGIALVEGMAIISSDRSYAKVNGLK